MPPTLCNPRVRDTITLLLTLGGMGLRSASRVVDSADQFTGLDGFDIPGWADFAEWRATTFTRIESQLFRVILLRRLRFPSPLSSRSCRCGRLSAIIVHRV